MGSPPNLILFLVSYSSVLINGILSFEKVSSSEPQFMNPESFFNMITKQMTGDGPFGRMSNAIDDDDDDPLRTIVSMRKPTTLMMKGNQPKTEEQELAAYPETDIRKYKVHGDVIRDVLGNIRNQGMARQLLETIYNEMFDRKLNDSTPSGMQTGGIGGSNINGLFNRIRQVDTSTDGPIISHTVVPIGQFVSRPPSDVDNNTDVPMNVKHFKITIKPKHVQNNSEDNGMPFSFGDDNSPFSMFDDLFKSAMPVMQMQNKQQYIHPAVNFEDVNTILPEMKQLMSHVMKLVKPGHVTAMVFHPNDVQTPKNAIKNSNVCCQLRRVLIGNPLDEPRDVDDQKSQAISPSDLFDRIFGNRGGNSFRKTPLIREDRDSDSGIESLLNSLQSGMNPSANVASPRGSGNGNVSPFGIDDENEWVEKNQPWLSHVVSHVMGNLDKFHVPNHVSAISFNPRPRVLNNDDDPTKHLHVVIHRIKINPQQAENTKSNDFNDIFNGLGDDNEGYQNEQSSSEDGEQSPLDAFFEHLRNIQQPSEINDIDSIPNAVEEPQSDLNLQDILNHFKSHFTQPSNTDDDEEQPHGPLMMAQVPIKTRVYHIRVRHGNGDKKPDVSIHEIPLHQIMKGGEENISPPKPSPSIKLENLGGIPNFMSQLFGGNSDESPQIGSPNEDVQENPIENGKKPLFYFVLRHAPRGAAMSSLRDL